MEAQSTHITNARVNKSLALAYALQGMTYTDIGKEFGVTQSAISQALADQRDNIEAFRAFSKHKDTFLEYEQWRLANLANDETRKKALTSRGYTDIGILEDKIRTIRGQVTEITANFDAVKAIDARRREIEARIRAIESGLEDRPQDVVLEAEISTPIMLESATNTVQHSDMTGTNGDSAKLTYCTLSDVGPRQGKRKGRPRKGR